MKKNNKLILVLILLLAGFLRFWQLGNLPASLNWDEISHGYNAYSVMKTSQDQWGVKFPIFNFRAYGDYPTTANLYLTIPFIKVLGLNAFSVRLPSALAGFAFVFLVYLFINTLFNSEPIAIFSAFLAAISPWAVFPSRGVFQSDLSQTLLLAGLYFFLVGLQKPFKLIFSAIFLGISVYAYHNTRIIVPLLIPILIFFYFPTIKNIFISHRFIFILTSLILGILVIPNLINLFSPESTARNRWVGIINPNSINLINEKRRIFTGPKIINLAVNNKAVFFLQSVVGNYYSLLEPTAIFFKGSQNYQFNPPDTGLIFPIFLPFLYLGLIQFILKSRHDAKYLFTLILFILCLLPSTLTTGDFPSIRATIALPFYFLFISFGLFSLNFRHKKYILLIVILCALLELINYSKIYLNYLTNYSESWQYGYQSAVDYAKSNYSQYHQIVFTKKYGEPHEFILFYWPWDPQKYITDNYKNTDFHADWYWVNSFDKFTFINDWEIKNTYFAPSTLLITSPENYPTKNSHLIKTINFLDSHPAFNIVSYE